MSDRRFTDKPAIDSTAVMELADDHPAMVENRTLFPSTVVTVTATVPDRLLISGVNNRKLGKTVEKGKFVGYGLYQLSLEERATCPASCDARAFCYGNGMQMARRHRIGDPEIFFGRLEEEIKALLETESGLLIRLHVLGDFPSVEYVAFWLDILNEYPNVACFGYTHRSPMGTDEIGLAIESVKFKFHDRFRIRWSSRRPLPDNAIVIDGQDLLPNPEEGGLFVERAIICPSQTEATACCATCSLCWETQRPIAFLKHGRALPSMAAKNAMEASVIVPLASFDGDMMASLTRLRHFALSLCKDVTLAEDLVQETVLKALANREQFEPGTNMVGWLSTILRNHYFTTIRKSSREQEDPDSQLASNTAADEQEIESSMDAKSILSLIDELPDAQARILRYVADGIPYEEIAEKENIELGTVKSRVNRAREALELRIGAPKAKADPPTLRSVRPIQLPRGMGKPIDLTPPEIRVVDPTTLMIEPAYQRDLTARSIGLIRKIVTEWDWAKFKPPICAETESGLFVVDGQHTAIAAASHPQSPKIPVLVAKAEQIKKRAESFVSHNRDRLAMSPYQLLYAEAVAGGKQAIDILAIVQRAGAFVPRVPPANGKGKPGEIVCVTALRRIYKGKGDSAALERVVKIAVAASCSPVTATIAFALAKLVSEPYFADASALPDTRIADALHNIKDFEKSALAASSEIGVDRYRAGAELIAQAALGVVRVAA